MLVRTALMERLTNVEDHGRNVISVTTMCTSSGTSITEITVETRLEVTLAMPRSSSLLYQTACMRLTAIETARYLSHPLQTSNRQYSSPEHTGINFRAPPKPHGNLQSGSRPLSPLNSHQRPPRRPPPSYAFLIFLCTSRRLSRKPPLPTHTCETTSCVCGEKRGHCDDHEEA